MRGAAETITPVTLELGGKSPQVVFDDADLDAAAQAIVGSALVTAGQVCSAGTRVLVQRGIHDELIDAVTERAREIRIGPPLEGAEMGPLISARQRERVGAVIDTAQSEGARARRRRQGPAGGRPSRRPLRHPDALRPGRPEQRAGPRGGVRPGPGADPLRRSARGAAARQRHRLRPRRRRLDARQRPRPLARPRPESRSDLHQQLRRRAAVSSCRSAASSAAGSGARRALVALNEYTQVKNVCVRVEEPS